MTDQLPFALYTAQQVQNLDKTAIEKFGEDSLDLMKKAGQVAFDQMLLRWPKLKKIGIVCSTGNNGGDGFVVAALALKAKLDVVLMLRGNLEKMKPDAKTCAKEFLQLGGEIHRPVKMPADIDVLVDALWGTGLDRDVEGSDAQWIEHLNQHKAPCVSIDVPSGLNANTGRPLGVAVKADLTVTFIGLKQGLFTGVGTDYVGEVFYHALDIPAKTYATEILSARRFDWKRLQDNLTPRPRHAHKGNFGHVFLVGGDRGYSGAIRLAAEAALRSGTGLVSVATHGSHAPMVNIQQPEIMVKGMINGLDLPDMIGKASVVVLGPGLGQSIWSKSLFEAVLKTDKSLVLDADGLNLLSQNPIKRDNWVLTPHPKEAARLLGCSVEDIEQDRFAAVEQLQNTYGGVALLKGAGTLVTSAENKPIAVCTDGNPGMASGGMGDLLSGIIGSFLAQNYELEEAAIMGACIHGAAADVAAEQGEKGMAASDLLPIIRYLLNPEIQF